MLLENLACNELSDLGKRCEEAYKQEGELGLAKLVVDELLEYYTPKACMAQEPPLLQRYERSSPEDKLKFDRENPYWRKTIKAHEYVLENEEVKRHNRSHLFWLRRFEPLLEGDELRHHKILDKIHEYDIPEEAKKVAEQFGGKVVERGWGEEE
uniref:Uncharacterized protein n=1 Tax=viral metagenome TaxID=1070528 RepID=A0A6M3JPS2_9ZZZZ